ncbi:NAD-P-binding protein [Crucibulum laeve]|uniref:NAD-P-binding protein n=1 Tax=Crucibulum laeve TaxID=68775 RepID=A0A5C3M4L5_9AGAR|nr:NAD-P-binding protein [Crucibulum laeve]
MGNLASRNFNPATDLVDLTGKVAIVTGGNAGIGLATVRHLARSHAKVYLAARSESKATAAIAALKKEFEEKGLLWGKDYGEILWQKLDLSDPRDAKKSAEEFLKKEERLDVLVNNAGMLSAPYEIGKDGVSTMVVVNYISPFVFTRTLLPLLQKTAQETDSDVRVVNVTSIMYKFAPSVKFDTIDDFNAEYKWRMMGRYAHSKLLILLWTSSLQAHLTANNSNITCIALHPGGVDTFSQRWPLPALSQHLVRLAIADPVVGAYNSVFAAAGKKVREDRETYKGAYLESQPTGRLVQLDEKVGEGKKGDLWKLTESFLEGIGCGL